MSQVHFFVSVCLAHCCNNGGNKTEFVILESFWKLLQDVFCQSDQAKEIWVEKAGESWKTYTANRWWSKQQVIEAV